VPAALRVSLFTCALEVRAFGTITALLSEYMLDKAPYLNAFLNAYNNQLNAL
jgi:hypothetical protein